MHHDNRIERADDSAYFNARAAEEAQHAQRAISPEAKRAHHDLASMLARKAAGKCEK
jgi:hypothetical protein